MIPIIESLLQVVGASLKIWDHYNKTAFYRDYKQIMLEIQAESGKDIHTRDQARVDRAQYRLTILLSDFNKQARATIDEDKDI